MQESKFWGIIESPIINYINDDINQFPIHDQILIEAFHQNQTIVIRSDVEIVSKRYWLHQVHNFNVNFAANFQI